VKPRTAQLLRLAWLGLLLANPDARAHTTPGSSLFLDFRRDGVQAELILPLEELQFAFGQPLLSAPDQILTQYETPLRAYLAEHLRAETISGQPWTVTVQELQTQLTTPPFGLVARVWLQPPADASPRQFNLHSSVINHEVMSHYTTVAVRHDWETAVFSGQPEPAGQILATQNTLRIDRTNGRWSRGFHSVVRLGMHHIAAGMDHLLFVLVILLPAPLLVEQRRWTKFGGLRRSCLQLLKIVSAFTVGHSFTLLVGATGWLRLPAQPVEVLIAVSILVSALHAIRPWFHGREAVIAAGFGLVHGLAFAESLIGYGFSAWDLAATVLGFNLGIELMQLFVVAITLPWLILLARTDVYPVVRILGAGFGAIAAGGWIVERTLAWPNPIGTLADGLGQHPVIAIGVLAAASLVATGWQALKTQPVPASPTPDASA
jgi:hypothetical protein